MNYIHMFLVFYTGFGSRTSSQLLYHLQVWETRKRVKKTSQAVLDSSAHRIFKLRPGSLLLSRLHTIVAVMMLNFRVRDGNGCVHHAIAARSSRDPSKPDTSSLLLSTLSNLGQVLGLLVPPR